MKEQLPESALSMPGGAGGCQGERSRPSAQGGRRGGWACGEVARQICWVDREVEEDCQDTEV